MLKVPALLKSILRQVQVNHKDICSSMYLCSISIRKPMIYTQLKVTANILYNTICKPFDVSNNLQLCSSSPNSQWHQGHIPTRPWLITKPKQTFCTKQCVSLMKFLTYPTLKKNKPNLHHGSFPQKNYDKLKIQLPWTILKITASHFVRNM